MTSSSRGAELCASSVGALRPDNAVDALGERQLGSALLPPTSPMPKHTILFLGANPVGTEARAIDREARAIQVELERSGRRNFEVHTWWAPEPLDLLRALRTLRPTVAHFCGHGDRQGLYFQAPDGSAQLVSTAALEETFGAAGASVKLVVLSACYSEPQAEALLAHVDCVVGSSGDSSSDATRNFAIGFYGGLGDQESVAAAYKQGCAAISLEGLLGERPRLKVRSTVDADRLVLGSGPLAPLPQTPVALLEVIEKLVALTGYRSERQDRIFSEILDPAFRDLERIHGNYITMFDEVLRRLPEVDALAAPTYRTRLLDCAEHLRQRRIEFEPVRARLTAMTKQVLGGRYGGRKPRFYPAADAFLDAVVAYFPSGFLAQRSAASLATSLYVAIRAGAEPITDDDVSLHGLLLPTIVGETIEDCRQRWSLVCERYADLKVAATVGSES